MQAQDAAQAAQSAKEATIILRKKVEEKIKKYSDFTRYDWTATKIQRFIQLRQKTKVESFEPVVIIDGIAYPFHTFATPMYDAELKPFNTQHARIAYEKCLKNLQNAANFGSRDNILSPHHQVVFIISCISKEIIPDPDILFGIFDEYVISHLLTLNLLDYPQLSRNIRQLNFLLNFQISDWIFRHFPLHTNLEEFVQFFIQEVQFELEEISKKQVQLAEMYWEPNPDNEIQCVNCQNINRVAGMFKLPQGSFYYCHQCAPMIGIFPNDF